MLISHLKPILIVLVVIKASFSLNATEQIPDILIYQQDTFYILGTVSRAFPLYPILESAKYSQEFTLDRSCLASNCYRGYHAVWRVRGKKLYLEQLLNCCTGEPIDISTLFKRKVNKRKGIKAFWLEEILILFSKPIGPLNFDEDVKVVELEFKKGKLMKAEVASE